MNCGGLFPGAYSWRGQNVGLAEARKAWTPYSYLLLLKLKTEKERKKLYKMDLLETLKSTFSGRLFKPSGFPEGKESATGA